MRRSELLKTAVTCPHFGRPVVAQRNAMTDRLVDCAEKDACRPTNGQANADGKQPFPRGCPVFPSLT